MGRDTVRERLDARARPGHDRRRIGSRLVVLARKRCDGIRVGDLMREHIAEGAELTDFELVVAHCLDFGVVAGRDEELHFAAELVADQLGNVLIHRQQALRGFVRFDAETHDAVVGASSFGMRIGGSEARDERGGSGNFQQLHIVPFPEWWYVGCESAERGRHIHASRLAHCGMAR